jgi:hypothetical protein
MTSALPQVMMKGMLKVEIGRLRRMTADATNNAASYTGDLQVQWEGIRDAAREELAAAESAYAERYGS